MPPSASSKSPRLSELASVKAPFLCPKSSLSMRFSGMAPQLMATKGRAARGERVWIDRATSSLPTPVSPLMSTVVLKAAAREMVANRPRIDALRATSWSKRFSRVRAARSSRFSRRRASRSRALRRVKARSAGAKGLVR